MACTKLLNCGHMCGGVLNEEHCLPCLHGCSNDSSLKQDADDMCMICFTEALSCVPAIQVTALPTVEIKLLMLVKMGFSHFMSILEKNVFNKRCVVFDSASFLYLVVFL